MSLAFIFVTCWWKSLPPTFFVLFCYMSFCFFPSSSLPVLVWINQKMPYFICSILEHPFTCCIVKRYFLFLWEGEETCSWTSETCIQAPKLPLGWAGVPPGLLVELVWSSVDPCRAAPAQKFLSESSCMEQCCRIWAIYSWQLLPLFFSCVALWS